MHELEKTQATREMTLQALRATRKEVWERRSMDVPQPWWRRRRVSDPPNTGRYPTGRPYRPF